MFSFRFCKAYCDDEKYFRGKVFGQKLVFPSPLLPHPHFPLPFLPTHPPIIPQRLGTCCHFRTTAEVFHLVIDGVDKGRVQFKILVVFTESAPLQCTGPIQS